MRITSEVFEKHGFTFIRCCNPDNWFDWYGWVKQDFPFEFIVDFHFPVTKDFNENGTGKLWSSHRDKGLCGDDILSAYEELLAMVEESKGA